MRRSPLRRLARSLARGLALILPRDGSEWAEAIARESDEVESGVGALLFVLSAARGAAAQRITEGRMTHDRDLRFAFMAGGLALLTGLVLMGAAGAPRSMMVVNGLAAILALVSFAYAKRLARLMAAWPGATALTAGGAILATALLAAPLDGVARWVSAGPISLQVSLLALPPLVAVAALRFTPLVAGGVALAAAGLALLPDRAMASALALALAVIAWRKPEAPRLAALLVCCAAAALAFMRPDPMPAVPFVDQLVPFAAGQSPLLAAAVAIAMALLVLPFLCAAGRRPPAAGLAAAWAGIVAAAFLGNYPSPLVGYGASAILGYALSCAFLALPAAMIAPAEGANPRADATSDTVELESEFAALKGAVLR